MKTVLRTALLLLAFGSGPAGADSDCRTPLADWQPREALQRKLERDGWTIQSIRVHDGCYRVRAIDTAGQRMELRFDPGTLEIVRRKRDDGDHDRGRGNDD